MFKRVLWSVIFLAIVVSTSVLASFNHPVWVIDRENTTDLPNHFRTTSSLPAIADLHAAAGSEFSVLGLQAFLTLLHVSHLTIIDLRQESHGVLNGAAVSWYGPQNAENAGKQPKEVEGEQQELLNLLSQTNQEKIYTIISKKKDGRINEATHQWITVQQVLTEEEVARQFNLGYERLYVQDSHGPSDDQVDRFIQIINQLPAGDWIYIHCRAGKGRSTTFLSMYDMMRHAKQDSFDTILARQVTIGGKDLTEMPDQKSYKYQYAVERLAFLKLFYQYARENNDNFKTSWSEWLKQRTD